MDTIINTMREAIESAVDDALFFCGLQAWVMYCTQLHFL